MSARQQTEWREQEPLYAPEMREVGEGPLARTRTGMAIGAAWRPPVASPMSDEAITVQGWLLPRSKSFEPLRVRIWDWVLYAIAVGLLVAFAMRWL